ncbi:MAG TPA: DUF222 domain-containing protein [Microlunatus sp.]
MSTGVSFTQRVARTGSALAAVDVPALHLSDADLVDVLDAVHLLEQRAAALMLDLIREADSRRLAKAQGATSLANWMSGRWRVSPGAAKRRVDLAGFVAVHRRVADGLRVGTVNTEQAPVIAKAVNAMPAPSAHASPLGVLSQPELDRRAAVRIRTGVNGSQALPPWQLGVAGRTVFAAVSPRQAEERDRLALERLERDAFDCRYLTVTPRALGGVDIRGVATTEQGAYLLRAFDALLARACPNFCVTSYLY